MRDFDIYELHPLRVIDHGLFNDRYMGVARGIRIRSRGQCTITDSALRTSRYSAMSHTDNRAKSSDEPPPLNQHIQSQPSSRERPRLN